MLHPFVPPRKPCQSLTETLLLFSSGAVIGLVFAHWAGRFLVDFLPLKMGVGLIKFRRKRGEMAGPDDSTWDEIFATLF
jgi:hypothetical protein